MTEEGRPTGIRQEDVEHLSVVNFEGRSARLYGRADVGEGVLLKLGFGDTHLALYGYFAGDEFMEVRRERID